MHLDPARTIVRANHEFGRHIHPGQHPLAAGVGKLREARFGAQEVETSTDEPLQTCVNLGNLVFPRCIGVADHVPAVLLPFRDRHIRAGSQAEGVQNGRQLADTGLPLSGGGKRLPVLRTQQDPLYPLLPVSQHPHAVGAPVRKQLGPRRAVLGIHVRREAVEELRQLERVLRVDMEAPNWPIRERISHTEKKLESKRRTSTVIPSR
jgi:hypothetical protein